MDGARATSEVSLEAVVESMAVANTVKRAPKAPAPKPVRPTAKMSEDEMSKLIAEAGVVDKSTNKIDSAKLRALGVVSVGESVRPPPAPAAEKLAPEKFNEHAPATSIVLDRGYEKALAKQNMQIERNDGDDGVTVPLHVIKDAVTIPLPKSLLAVLPNVTATEKKKKAKRDLAGFAVGVVVGLASVLGIVAALG